MKHLLTVVLVLFVTINLFAGIKVVKKVQDGSFGLSGHLITVQPWKNGEMIYKTEKLGENKRIIGVKDTVIFYIKDIQSKLNNLDSEFQLLWSMVHTDAFEAFDSEEVAFSFNVLKHSLVSEKNNTDPYILKGAVLAEIIIYK